jgi:hypothetical protein
VSTTDVPQPDATPWPTAPPGTPGLKIGFPGAHEAALPAHRLSHRAKIIMLVAGLGVLTVTLVVVALLATPGPVPACNPLKPGCQGPPIDPPTQFVGHGAAISDGLLYKNAQGFTVRYPGSPSLQQDSQGVELTYDYSNGGPSYIEILGSPAGSATPQTAVESFASSEFQNTQPVYELPDPLIGYQPAYGVAFDVQPASSDGSTGSQQVVVAAAIKDGFVVLVQVDGTLLPPVTPSVTTYWNGHPSPAGTNMAFFAGDIIMNRISFP